MQRDVLNLRSSSSSSHHASEDSGRSLRDDDWGDDVLFTMIGDGQGGDCAQGSNKRRTFDSLSEASSVSLDRTITEYHLEAENALQVMLDQLLSRTRSMQAVQEAEEVLRTSSPIEWNPYRPPRGAHYRERLEAMHILEWRSFAERSLVVEGHARPNPCTTSALDEDATGVYSITRDCDDAAYSLPLQTSASPLIVVGKRCELHHEDMPSLCMYGGTEEEMVLCHDEHGPYMDEEILAAAKESPNVDVALDKRRVQRGLPSMLPPRTLDDEATMEEVESRVLDYWQRIAEPMLRAAGLLKPNLIDDDRTASSTHNTTTLVDHECVRHVSTLQHTPAKEHQVGTYRRRSLLATVHDHQHRGEDNAPNTTLPTASMTGGPARRGLPGRSRTSVSLSPPPRRANSSDKVAPHVPSLMVLGGKFHDVEHSDVGQNPRRPQGSTSAISSPRSGVLVQPQRRQRLSPIPSIPHVPSTPHDTWAVQQDAIGQRGETADRSVPEVVLAPVMGHSQRHRTDAVLGPAPRRRTREQQHALAALETEAEACSVSFNHEEGRMTSAGAIRVVGRTCPLNDRGDHNETQPEAPCDHHARDHSSRQVVGVRLPDIQMKRMATTTSTGNIMHRAHTANARSAPKKLAPSDI